MNTQEKVGKAVIEALMRLLVISITITIGLLLAFPIKWTWNITMPYIFNLPLITWGKSWCLFFLSNCLIKGWPRTNEKKSG
jgi:hypothetical protein